MLHILFIILKIIGIMLLSILGLFLLLILTILLIPIRYVSKGEFNQEKTIKLKVSWLLSLFSFHLIYEEGEVKSSFKILAFTIKAKKKEETLASVKENLDESVEEGIEIIEASDDSNELLEDEIEVETEKYKASEEAEKLFKEKKTSWWKKLKFTFHKFCDRIKSIRDNKNKFIQFISKEENKKVFKLIKSQVFAFLKHIRPRRLRGSLEFGFEDPSITGCLLGVFYMFYPVYHNNFTIKGNFETVIIKGHFFLKGRIRVLSLLIIAIKLFMDKNFRSMLKMIKK